MSKPMMSVVRASLSLTGTVAALLTWAPADLSAQRAPAPAASGLAPDAALATSLDTDPTTASCDLATESGLRLSFAACGGSVQADATRTTGEVEVIEYRNGDQRVRTELRVEGVVHRDLAARSLWVRYGDSVVARTGPSVVWEVRIALHGSGPEGVGVLQGMWDARARDGASSARGGQPVEIAMRDDTGGGTSLALDRCVPETWTADTAELVLRCDTVRPVGTLDRNPYARFVLESSASSTGGRTRPVTLMDTRAERATPTLAPSVRGRGDGRPTGLRRYRLQGATLQGWSIDFAPDGPAGAVARWTLEVRVARIEMA